MHRSFVKVLRAIVGTLTHMDAFKTMLGLAQPTYYRPDAFMARQRFSRATLRL